MQWTDEQINDILKLASEGFTRREAAFMMQSKGDNNA